MCLAELTVCFESNFTEAAQRKTAKYMDLLQQARSSGYKAELLTLQVGSRGVPHYDSFQQLAEISPTSSSLLLEQPLRVRLGSGAPGVRKPNTPFFPSLPLSLLSFLPLFSLCVCVVEPGDCAMVFVYHLGKMIMAYIHSSL